MVLMNLSLDRCRLLGAHMSVAGLLGFHELNLSYVWPLPYEPGTMRTAKLQTYQHEMPSLELAMQPML